MKKSFKTIMALTAALAISMSGMYITTADEEPTPPTTQSVVVDEDGDGIFDSSPSIPVTFNAEHLLSVTIEFGDMLMSYDFKDTSKDNNYGWGNSFNEENNKLTITNNSTCPVSAALALNIDTETYPCLEEFLFKIVDSNGDYIFHSPGTLNFQLTYSEALDFYLKCETVYSPLTGMHNYNFNNAKIGQFTITLEPYWQTL